MTPQRIHRQRTKGWRMPPNTVCVSRPGKWGNPFICGPAFESESMSLPEVTPAIATEAYRSYLQRSLANHASTREALETLRGKNLACWCKPGTPCHADVLLELANT